MRTVYSTEAFSADGVQVLGIDKLSPVKRAWVVSNRKRLLRRATTPERIARRMLSRIGRRVTAQAFFMIRGRSYFLDFFFPDAMTAVEIDGSIHKLTKEHDRKRDADFRSIGIRTIRVKNEDVMLGKLYDRVFTKMYP